jgi:hypothetical protein
MIARVQALSGLEFNAQAVKSNTKPNVESTVEDPSSIAFAVVQWAAYLFLAKTSAA